MGTTGTAKKGTNWMTEVQEGDSFCTDPRDTDLVIALMGPTGAGKSTFINTFIGEEVTIVGHNILSETAYVGHFFVKDPQYPGRRIVLIDTPGFNDTYIDDKEILRRIAVWLARSYADGMKLSGLIYLHNILENRMNGSARTNLELFQKLCGQEASKKVILATTMWDDIREEAGEKREQQLKDLFWKDMLAHGSSMVRFDATEPSARNIVHSLLAQNHLAPIQIQQELGDQDKSIPETAAALALRRHQESLPVPTRTTSNGPDVFIMKPIWKKSKKSDWQRSIQNSDPSIKDPRNTDRVIVVFGPTGSGKSTFINTLMGECVATVGHGLVSQTAHVQHFTFPDPGFPERRIVVVDTPSFDHTSLPDEEVLRRIAIWLARSYDAGMKVVGLIYLEDITRTRPSNRVADVDLVLKLAGEGGSKKLVCATTKWDRVPRLEVGERREEQWKNTYFKTMLDRGAVMARFTGTQRSAQDIVGSLLTKNDDEPLWIQRELVDLGEMLGETDAETDAESYCKVLEARERVGASRRGFGAPTADVVENKEKVINNTAFYKVLRLLGRFTSQK